MLHWFKYKLWIQKGIMKPNPITQLSFLFPPVQGSRLSEPYDKKKVNFDTQLLDFFYFKYPEAQFTNNFYSSEPDQFNSNFPKNIGLKFIEKQKKYMKDGFSKSKAFEIVEKDMGKTLQKEKSERSFLEGIATSNRARSLMTVYEQEMEFEARQKIKTLGRDIGEFQRNDKEESERMDELMGRRQDFKTVESLEKDKKYVLNKAYEPVSCKHNLFNLFKICLIKLMKDHTSLVRIKTFKIPLFIV